MAMTAEVQSARRTSKYATAKAEAIASFAAFTRGEVEAPRYPLEVFLEVSNLCNAKCVMCAVFSALNPNRLDLIRADQRNHMLHADHIMADEELFAHALNVHLFGFGEPTIHPRFQELVRRVGQYEVIIDFFTNGMKLHDEGLIETIIEAQVERLTLSFSGATKELYENVYQGCSWDTVLSGLRVLAQKKRAAGSKYPQVYVNSLAWAHHLEALEDFVVLMAEHGASVIEVKQLVPYNTIPELAPHVGRTRTESDLERVERAKATALGHGIHLMLHHGLDQLDAAGRGAPGVDFSPTDFLPIERLRERASGIELKKGRPPPRPKAQVSATASYDEVRAQLEPTVTKAFHCMEPFKTLYVRQEGLTKPCCFMSDSEHALGDVSKQPGVDVWRGSGHRALREGSLTGVYPVRGCGACLRNNDGPPTHFAHYLFYRYEQWYENAFGTPFRAEPGLLVPDGETIARLHAANAGIDRALRGVANAPYVEGYLDHVWTESIDGWAWAPAHPEVRLPISIWSNGRLIAKTVASEHRPDVEATGRGDGRYGFRYFFPKELRPAVGDIVAVTAGVDDQPLGTSPQQARDA